MPVTSGGTASFEMTAYSPDEIKEKDGKAVELVSAKADLGSVPILLNLFSPSDGIFKLHLTNTEKNNFVLLASTNLVNWNPILTNSNPDGAFDYIETNANRYHSRYFRVVPFQ